MPCPHPGLQVGGRCYFCLKVAATNGHRSKLSVEQLTFVGFVTEVAPVSGSTAWIPASRRSNAERELEEELARLRDVMPGYFALAKRILENEKEES